MVPIGKSLIACLSPWHFSKLCSKTETEEFEKAPGDVGIFAKEG